jgi:hypothetical protein
MSGSAYSRFTQSGPSLSQPPLLPIAQQRQTGKDIFASMPPASVPLTIGGLTAEEQAELAQAREDYNSKPGNGCKSIVVAAGGLALLCVLAMSAVFIWRGYVFQDDITRLNNRLIIAEALLVNHTLRINSLNTTLITTIGRVTHNEADILSQNHTLENHETRIKSLENRTTLLEGRMTAAELNILGLMNNVTILQAEMIAVQADLAVIHAEITLLQQNASNHEARIVALEQQMVINTNNIQLLFTYLENNLTVIDQRLNELNTTYTVTASGSAMVKSGPSTPVTVTWETRHFRSVGGLDVEYLWISDMHFVPILIQLQTSVNGYSFQVTNFTSSKPVQALPAPSLALDRPLGTYQQSKFFTLSSVPNATVWSTTWNNTEVSLDFKTNLVLFDAAAIVTPLTFVIGFA